MKPIKDWAELKSRKTFHFYKSNSGAIWRMKFFNGAEREEIFDLFILFNWLASFLFLCWVIGRRPLCAAGNKFKEFQFFSFLPSLPFTFFLKERRAANLLLLIWKIVKFFNEWKQPMKRKLIYLLSLSWAAQWVDERNGRALRLRSSAANINQFFSLLSINWIFFEEWKDKWINWFVLLLSCRSYLASIQK